MKKSTRNIIIIASVGFCLIVIGGIIAGIGYGSHGKFAMESADYGIFSVPSWTDGSASRDHFHSSIESPVHTLKLHGDVGDLEIVQGDALSIDGTNVRDGDIKVQENNGVLDVRISQKKRFILFGYIPERKVVIILPEAVKIIDAEMNVGDMHVANINAEQIRLHHNVGDLDIKNVTADSVDIKVNTGDLEFSGDFKNTMQVKSNVGDVDVRLAGSMNEYDYDITNNLGDMNLGNEHQSGANRSYETNNNTGRLLRLKNDLGDSDITFKNW